MNRTYNSDEVSYSYYDISFTLDELKYINENIATVYIDADINVVLEEAADFEGKQEDNAATVQSDYVIISLDELLNK